MHASLLIFLLMEPLTQANYEKIHLEMNNNPPIYSPYSLSSVIEIISILPDVQGKLIESTLIPLSLSHLASHLSKFLLTVPSNDIHKTTSSHQFH